MKCPNCGAYGAASDEEVFEVRGQVEGRPVRKCRNCGEGLMIGRLGRARLIPDEIWSKMDAEWEQAFQGQVKEQSREETAGVAFLRDSLREAMTAEGFSLAEARENIESVGVVGQAVDAATDPATVDAYARSHDLIVKFVESELYPSAEGRQAERESRPLPFAAAFPTELERADTKEVGLGLLPAGGGSYLIALGIAKVMVHGFAACAINQQLRREAGYSALEPATTLHVEDIRRVWFERIDDEHERLIVSNRELGAWVASVCGHAYTSLVVSAGSLGIIETRHSLGSAEALTDQMMIQNRMLAVTDAYPGAETLDPFLIFYSTAGWTLYLANTPLWHLTSEIPDPIQRKMGDEGDKTFGRVANGDALQASGTESFEQAAASDEGAAGPLRREDHDFLQEEDWRFLQGMDWRRRMRAGDLGSVCEEIFHATLNQFPDGFSSEIEHGLDLATIFVARAPDNAPPLGTALRFVAARGVAVRFLEEPLERDPSTGELKDSSTGEPTTEWMRDALTRVAGELDADISSIEDFWTVATAMATQFARTPAQGRPLPDPTGVKGFGSDACERIAHIALKAVDDFQPPPKPWNEEELDHILAGFPYGYAIAIARRYAPV